VLDARGEKLSKQHGAPAIDTRSAAACLAALRAAARVLELPPADPVPLPVAEQLARWIPAWRERWGPPGR
jgi:glutamyl-Q tRNA(Asp) synthetase